LAIFHRDAKLKLAILAATGLVGGAFALSTGLRFPWSDAVAPLAITVVLGPCAVFYQRRHADQFVATLLAVMQLLIFTACFTVLMYSLASLGLPLRDDVLSESDALLGIHVPAVVEWTRSHPGLDRVVTYAYNSVLPQMLILVLLLGFSGDKQPLEQFVLRFMIALLITAAVFAVIPAKGPFALYDLPTNPTQDRFVEQFDALRSGEMTSVSLRDTEGLVTFPSFHTTWAILLAAAVWHRRRLFVLVVGLNALVILGTMTTGWHYFADVLGGIAVAVAAILLSNVLRPWLDKSAAERFSSRRG